MVLLGAELGKRLVGMPVPDSIVRGAADDRAVQSLADQVIERMWERSSDGGAILRASSFHMKARERWQDRVRYFVRLTTTTSVGDWESFDLPPSLGFLYPLLRFSRLVRKYWMRVP